MDNELKEVIEEKKEKIEEKAAEVKEAVEEKLSEVKEAAEEKAAEHWENLQKDTEAVKEKLETTLNDLHETLANDAGEKVADEEQQIELTLKPADAMVQARKEVDQKYGSEEAEPTLKTEVSGKVEQAKKNVSETFGNLKETAMNVGSNISEKAKEAGEKFKTTEAGKTLLGDDGKFDMEDVERIGENVAEAGGKVIDKVADWLQNTFKKK